MTVFILIVTLLVVVPVQVNAVYRGGSGAGISSLFPILSALGEVGEFGDENVDGVVCCYC